jgi:predicted RNA-binding protein with TRAM domain
VLPVSYLLDGITVGEVKRMSFGQRRGGYGSRGGMFGSKKPVEVGKEYNVTISEISRRGDGIAKIDGFVIFVPGTKQGQSTRISVTQVGERFASGQVVERTAETTTTSAAPATSESAEKSA